MDDGTLITRLKERARDANRAYSFCTGIDTYEYYPPLLTEEILIIEKRVGFRLPSLLRTIYAQVGNGGYGPGYGLTGLTDDGALAFTGMNAIDMYLIFGSEQDEDSRHLWWWPEKAIPFCDYDDKVLMLVDCSSDEGCIMRREYNGSDDRREDFTVVEDSLRDWLIGWIEGRVK